VFRQVSAEDRQYAGIAGLICLIKMLKLYGVMLQFEFLRGPLDWGFRLLGQAPGAGTEGLGRVFAGAGVAFNTSGEVEFGITYLGPPYATMVRIWGAFCFASFEWDRVSPG